MHVANSRKRQKTLDLLRTFWAYESEILVADWLDFMACGMG